MKNLSRSQIKIFGSESESVYIYVHGLNGSKEEAVSFAEVAGKSGFQVLSFDIETFDPVTTPPELEAVYDFASRRWQNISLYAVSIGAWFSIVSFSEKPITRTLLVSPVLSMKAMIERMMSSSGVTPEQLKEHGTIENLSWAYYSFACENEITVWTSDTRILYAENDNIVPFSEAEEFAGKFGASLTVMPNGEHWFHTPEQLKFLREWEAVNIS